MTEPKFARSATPDVGERANLGPRERQGALLRWADVARRDLPWRRTRDPWAVLVSEVMLQQTQVARVEPRFAEFLARFPDAPACASEPAAEVIKLWSGLGYNRRALNLHRCAVEVTEHHGGDLPRTLPELLALPGIGPYTARAVLAFAYERDVGIVDTNAARVLARWHGRSMRPREVQQLADETVPSGDGWAWNQAMLDLGATVCTKRQPNCASCPVSGSCAWRGSGPDPAVGSAGVSGGQSRFEGSDRQGRGKLVKALGNGPVRSAEVATVMGWLADPDRADRVARQLVTEGMVTVDDRGTFHLG